MTYRKLTDEEILVLENNNCRADDWESVNVSDDFNPAYLRDVVFYGEIFLGDFDRNIEVSPSFLKHSGIYSATLRNVTVGDNCLIEHVNNYINNYTIGDNCYISNIATLETTEGTTYGQGNIISVMKPSSEGNVVLCTQLNSQLATLMVKYSHDKELRETLRNMARETIDTQLPERGIVGDGVKIVNTVETTNTILGDYCEVNGAARLSDTTVMGTADASVFIGTGVICENSIISDGASLLNHAIVQDCFIGEACKISNGFTAGQSVVFANSNLSKGETCAAFCGPFTTSLTKKAQLTNGMYGLYDNFHGEILRNPNMRNLPFSRLTTLGETTYLTPAFNITTIALYRAIHKWPRHDMRPQTAPRSIVNFDWLSPFSVSEIIEAKQILENLRKISGEDAPNYSYHGLIIRGVDLQKGIQNYDMALRIYMGAVIERIQKYDPDLCEPTTNTGLGQWGNLAGLLLPVSEERQIVEDIKDGTLESIDAILRRFDEIHAEYRNYQWVWTYQFILNYYGLSELTPADADMIIDKALKARRNWTEEISRDAETEYQLGKIDHEALKALWAHLDHETDIEN
ncbi:MAG: DUF4954 family protein [Prevotella sp.]|nr:DUF4954 family protein [Prevotella sp.]